MHNSGRFLAQKKYNVPTYFIGGGQFNLQSFLSLTASLSKWIKFLRNHKSTG